MLIKNENIKMKKTLKHEATVITTLDTITGYPDTGYLNWAMRQTFRTCTWNFRSVFKRM